MKRLLISITLCIVIASTSGCGNSSANAPSPQGSEQTSSPVIAIPSHQDPLGVKKKSSQGPTVGYPPKMPGQIRITNPPVQKTTIASRLKVPWDMEFTDDGQKLFFTERPRRINVISFGDTEPHTRQWLSREEVLNWGEAGLMGIALHPSFQSGGGPKNWVYLCETYGSYNNARNRIVRVSKNGGGLREVLIEGMPAASYHDGCRMEFGPDGYLYATMGDAGDPDSAQDLDSWSGKIIRMTPGGQPAPENPFEGEGARSYVYSYGHRNPQGLAWHPRSNKLYSSEHGPSGEFGLSGHDEINQIEIGSNYGWPRVIGAPALESFQDPIMMFPDPHLPPAGMDFTDAYSRDESLTSLFVGSLRGETLLRAIFDGDGNITEIQRWFERDFFSGTQGRIRAVTTGPEGNLFISTSNRDGRGNPQNKDDRIIKLSPESR